MPPRWRCTACGRLDAAGYFGPTGAPDDDASRGRCPPRAGAAFAARRAASGAEVDAGDEDADAAGESYPEDGRTARGVIRGRARWRVGDIRPT